MMVRRAHCARPACTTIAALPYPISQKFTCKRTPPRSPTRGRANPNDRPTIKASTTPPNRTRKPSKDTKCNADVARANALPRHVCTSRPASNDNPSNSFRATDECPNLPDSYPQIMTPSPGGALVSNEDWRAMRSGNVAHITIESIIAHNSTASLCNFNLRLAQTVPSQSSGLVQSRRQACANPRFKQESDEIHF